MQKNAAMGKDYLYCYIMTYDTGFAPNPEHGFLTLATCKPTIRRCAYEGSWISGWAGVNVYATQDKKEFYTDKAQKLIYLAQITKKVDFDQYWVGEKFQNKKPENSICGDNIYEPNINERFGFKRHENGGGHGEKEKEHDLSGNNVLICDEFYYFGIQNALDVMSELKDDSFVVPRCKKIPMSADVSNRIIEIVKNHISQAKFYSNGNK